MRVFSFAPAALAVALIFFSTSSFAEVNFDNVDIEGFRLGMTMDEVRKAYPDARFRDVKPDGKIIIGYNTMLKGVLLSFSIKELGGLLFSIQKSKMYPAKKDSYPVFQKLKEKYGPPDFTGRQMFTIQACWGRCYGNHRRLEFRMKTGSLKSTSFPMTLTLSDPAISKKNTRKFLEVEKAARK